MADSSTSSTSSISQGALKTRKPSHFRAKIKVQNIEIVVRKLHQNTIKLSVKNLKKNKATILNIRGCKLLNLVMWLDIEAWLSDI
ncbi:hypothetical protein Ahy_A05g024885 isoform E [Arachis hypogaea]|uniref:Uncharacterized protein n=1 Tax=Arachis hypogaea TaxID=3818 RepID=A0A445D7C9_ARAHY|nr:hypothetical protein Ahy_A05g024885 isoform E [Arachis hypogaea]